MLINLDLATDLVKHHLMLHKINVADCISNSLQFGSVFILYVAKKLTSKSILISLLHTSTWRRSRSYMKSLLIKKYMKYFALKFAISLLTWTFISLIFHFLGYASLK